MTIPSLARPLTGLGKAPLRHPPCKALVISPQTAKVPPGLREAWAHSMAKLP